MSDITDPDPRHLRETMIMLNRAIVNGWQIPDAIMSAAPMVVARVGDTTLLPPVE